MNTAVAWFCIPMGVIAIIMGIYWTWRASEGEDDEMTIHGKRLIGVGVGQYETEGRVAFRGIGLVLFGIALIYAGLLALA